MSQAGDTKTSERLRNGARELGDRMLHPGGKRPTRRTKRRAIAWAVFATLVAAVLILGLDAVLSARHMLARVKLARDELIDGSTAVVSGDPAGATKGFQAAAAAADAALAAADHPGLRALGALPIFGSNVDAAKAVAQAERSSAEAGAVMTEVADQLDWRTFSLPAVRNLGHVDLAAIRAVTPKIDQVYLILHDALRTLQAAGSGHLIGPIATGYQETLDTLSHRAALAGDAHALFELLPRLLGAGGERRYLLAVGSLAVPYGPGGRVGPVGILTASHGTLTLNPLIPADRSIGDAATSPDFPDDAAAMLAAAQLNGQGSLNGVIMIDTVGLQNLLWMVGDVKSTSWPAALSFANGVSTLDGDVLTGTSAKAADDQQATLAGDVLSAALARRPSTEGFATAMARSVATRHLMIYTTDPSTQQLLARLGATGRLITADNPIGFAWNTTGAPRTGALVRRQMSVGVSLDDHGAARMQSVIDLENRAPNTPPSVLLGPATGVDPVGSYAAEVGVYLPPRASDVTVETSSPATTGVKKDHRLPVATADLSTPSGGSMSMIVTARVRHAAQRAGRAWIYRLRIVPQATAVADPLHVRISIPEGMSLLSTSAGVQMAGSKATFVGTTARPVILTITYG